MLNRVIINGLMLFFQMCLVYLCKQAQKKTMVLLAMVKAHWRQLLWQWIAAKLADNKFITNSLYSYVILPH